MFSDEKKVWHHFQQLPAEQSCKDTSLQHIFIKTLGNCLLEPGREKAPDPEWTDLDRSDKFPIEPKTKRNLTAAFLGYGRRSCTRAAAAAGRRLL